MKESKLKIYFIGIGGIGISALAKYYFKKGAEVLGSDLVSSEITEDLKRLGIKIFIGKHKGKNVPKDANLVIFSPAIEEKNPELKRAKRLKIKCQSYPQALGKITKNYFTIAVCGSHGKSTTAAMIGLILAKAKLDPTVILGTKLKEFSNSNCRVGKGKYLVIEADEYKESFLNYWPKIIVLLNIDFDHPDYFKTQKHYILAFKKFVSHLPKNGVLVANFDDKIIRREFSGTKKKILWFSLKDKEVKFLKKELKLPGKFNLANALAALKVAKFLKIPNKISFQALSKFKGSWRRLEEKIVKLPQKNSSIRVIHDYAHHPTQIINTIEAIREKYSKKKVILIYQPHQYQRTFYFWNSFIKTFKEIPADLIIITDIYNVKGREQKAIMKKVSAKKMVKEIAQKHVFYLPKIKIVNFLKKILKGREIVIFMGAGDIYNLGLKFASCH